MGNVFPTSKRSPDEWDDASINRSIEEVFLRLRAGKQAQRSLEGGLPARGAIAIFPVAIFAPGQNVKRSLRPYALRMDIEPGAVLPVGSHRIRVTAELQDYSLVGHFTIVVGGPSSPIPEAKWALKDESGEGVSHEWVEGLPGSFLVAPEARTRLKSKLRKMTGGIEAAYSDLYHLSLPTMRAALQKYQNALFHQSGSTDMGDVIQECWVRHLQRVEAFASPQRPNATWRQILVINTRRDGGREIRRNPNKISDQVAQLVGIIRSNPELTTPEAVQRHVTIAKEVARLAKKNPGVSLHELSERVERDWEDGKVKPRVSLRVAEGAFLAVPFEGTTSLSAPLGSEGGDYEDLTPDPKSDTSAQHESQQKEQDIVEVIQFLLPPEHAKSVIIELGLLPEGYTFGDTERMTPSELRKKMLRRFRMDGEKWDQSQAMERARWVLLDEDGKLRRPDEIRKLLVEAEGRLPMDETNWNG